MIAFIANRFNALNGADLMGRDILRGLLEAGTPLTVVSADSPESVGISVTGDSKARLQWRSPPLPVLAPTPSWLGPLAGPVSRISERIALRHDGHQLEQSSRDGIIVNGFSNHWIFRYVRHMPPEKPRALIVHDSPKRYALPGQPPLGWALHIMERYSHFVFCSLRVAHEWLETGVLVGRQHCCIPYCCREDDVSRVRAQDRLAVRERLGLPVRRFVVVCPATIQHRKGQDLLLDSLPVLASAIPDLLLCLVGAPLGEWGESLVKQIRASEFRDRIQVVGARRDALEFIYAADAMVLPSRSEAAPVSILEAMALKTPVIASEISGVPELIEHDRSGLLFTSENRYELVQSLISLAKDPDRRKFLADNAERRYWTQFSRAHLIAGYAAALHSLANLKPWIARSKPEENPAKTQPSPGLAPPWDEN